MALHALLRSLNYQHHFFFLCSYCLYPQGGNNLLSLLSGQHLARGMSFGTNKSFRKLEREDMSSFVPQPQFAPASLGGTRTPAGPGETSGHGTGRQGDILHSSWRLSCVRPSSSRRAPAPPQGKKTQKKTAYTVQKERALLGSRGSRGALSSNRQGQKERLSAVCS